MPTRRTAWWSIRAGLATCSTGFGIFLLVKAWASPLDGSAALFTPLAFAGALLSFGLAVALLMPHAPAVPRSGRPAAR